MTAQNPLYLPPSDPSTPTYIIPQMSNPPRSTTGPGGSRPTRDSRDNNTLDRPSFDRRNDHTRYPTNPNNINTSRDTDWPPPRSENRPLPRPNDRDNDRNGTNRHDNQFTSPRIFDQNDQQHHLYHPHVDYPRRHDQYQPPPRDNHYHNSTNTQENINNAPNGPNGQDIKKKRLTVIKATANIPHSTNTNNESNDYKIRIDDRNNTSRNSNNGSQYNESHPTTTPMVSTIRTVQLKSRIDTKLSLPPTSPHNTTPSHTELHDNNNINPPKTVPQRLVQQSFREELITHPLNEPTSPQDSSFKDQSLSQPPPFRERSSSVMSRDPRNQPPVREQYPSRDTRDLVPSIKEHSSARDHSLSLSQEHSTRHHVPSRDLSSIRDLPPLRQQSSTRELPLALSKEQTATRELALALTMKSSSKKDISLNIRPSINPVNPLMRGLPPFARDLPSSARDLPSSARDLPSSARDLPPSARDLPKNYSKDERDINIKYQDERNAQSYHRDNGFSQYSNRDDREWNRRDRDRNYDERINQREFDGQKQTNREFEGQKQTNREYETQRLPNRDSEPKSLQNRGYDPKSSSTRDYDSKSSSTRDYDSKSPRPQHDSRRHYDDDGYDRKRYQYYRDDEDDNNKLNHDDHTIHKFGHDKFHRDHRDADNDKFHHDARQRYSRNSHDRDDDETARQRYSRNSHDRDDDPRRSYNYDRDDKMIDRPRYDYDREARRGGRDDKIGRDARDGRDDRDTYHPSRRHFNDNNSMLDYDHDHPRKYSSSSRYRDDTTPSSSRYPDDTKASRYESEFKGANYNTRQDDPSRRSRNFDYNSDSDVVEGTDDIHERDQRYSTIMSSNQPQQAPEQHQQAHIEVISPGIFQSILQIIAQNHPDLAIIESIFPTTIDNDDNFNININDKDGEDVSKRNGDELGLNELKGILCQFFPSLLTFSPQDQIKTILHYCIMLRNLLSLHRTIEEQNQHHQEMKRKKQLEEEMEKIKKNRAILDKKLNSKKQQNTNTTTNTVLDLNEINDLFKKSEATAQSNARVSRFVSGGVLNGNTMAMTNSSTSSNNNNNTNNNNNNTSNNNNNNNNNNTFSSSTLSSNDSTSLPLSSNNNNINNSTNSMDNTTTTTSTIDMNHGLQYESNLFARIHAMNSIINHTTDNEIDTKNPLHQDVVDMLNNNGVGEDGNDNQGNNGGIAQRGSFFFSQSPLPLSNHYNNLINEGHPDTTMGVVVREGFTVDDLASLIEKIKDVGTQTNGAFLKTNNSTNNTTNNNYNTTNQCKMVFKPGTRFILVQYPQERVDVEIIDAVAAHIVKKVKNLMIPDQNNKNLDNADNHTQYELRYAQEMFKRYVVEQFGQEEKQRDQRGNWINKDNETINKDKQINKDNEIINKDKQINKDNEIYNDRNESNESTKHLTTSFQPSDIATISHQDYKKMLNRYLVHVEKVGKCHRHDYWKNDNDNNNNNHHDGHDNIVNNLKNCHRTNNIDLNTLCFDLDAKDSNNSKDHNMNTKLFVFDPSSSIWQRFGFSFDQKHPNRHYYLWKLFSLMNEQRGEKDNGKDKCIEKRDSGKNIQENENDKQDGKNKRNDPSVEDKVTNKHVQSVKSSPIHSFAPYTIIQDGVVWIPPQ